MWEIKESIGYKAMLQYPSALKKGLSTVRLLNIGLHELVDIEIVI